MTNSRGKNKEAEKIGHSGVTVSPEAGRSTRRAYSMESPFSPIHQGHQDHACDRGSGISKNFHSDCPLKGKTESQRVITELGSSISVGIMEPCNNRGQVAALNLQQLTVGRAAVSITTRECGEKELTRGRFGLSS